jgi:hypothetical protein
MMLKEVRKAGRFLFSREDYLKEEAPTFNALGWTMMCVTPLHFLQSFISMGLLYEDDKVQTASSLNFDKYLERARALSESYLDIYLRTVYPQSLYRPSVVALSCVLAARRALQVQPILSERMKEMALLEECYSDDTVYEEIGECYEKVCLIIANGGSSQGSS